MRRFLLSFRLRAIALIFVLVYLSAAALSLVVAHILIVVRPESGLGERLIGPVGRGLEFLDTHWKGVLIMVVPSLSLHQSFENSFLDFVKRAASSSMPFR